MKKLIALVLILIMSLTLFSCSRIFDLTLDKHAIALAAEENGVSIVFDTDGNSVPFIVKGVAIDLTPSVLKILGVNQ